MQLRNPLSVLIIISAQLHFNFVGGSGLPLTCLTWGFRSELVRGFFTLGKGDGIQVLGLLSWSWELEQKAGVEVAVGTAWLSWVVRSQMDVLSAGCLLFGSRH